MSFPRPRRHSTLDGKQESPYCTKTMDTHFLANTVRSARLSLALAVGAILLVVGPAVADESVNWSHYNGWQVTSFRLRGMPAGMERELRRGLALAGQWKLLKGKQRPEFSANLLATDLARVRLFLAERGYPAARVVPEPEADRDARRLGLSLRVEPGPPVRIAEIEFNGWPSGLAMPDSSVSGALVVGQIFTDESVMKGIEGALAFVRNEGYAEAGLQYELLPMGANRVGVRLIVQAGEKYTVDEVLVVGCREDLRGLALRVINIPPGTTYADDLVVEALVDLRLTQLFRQIDVSREHRAPGSLRLRFDLADTRMRTWDAAIGTWTDNPWLVRAGWTHRNLFAGGRGFNVRTSVATHEVTGGVGLFWLGWLSPRALTRAGLDFVAKFEDAYDSEEYRAEIAQSFRPRRRDVLNVGTAVSENRIYEYSAGAGEIPEPQGQLWEFWVDRKWDGTDDPLFPSRGGFLKVSVTTAEPWLVSVVPYVSGQIDAAGYRGLPGGMIATVRLRLGAAWPLRDDALILANRRFFAGGYNTHRGYERRSLGPRDSDGDSRGGEAVLLGSSELRIPLVGFLEAALFCDSGNVWQTPSQVSLSEYPVAVGAALGARTILGQVRIGYGVNIADQLPDSPRELWHLGIGYSW